MFPSLPFFIGQSTEEVHVVFSYKYLNVVSLSRRYIAQSLIKFNYQLWIFCNI